MITFRKFKRRHYMMQAGQLSTLLAGKMDVMVSMF
ncbi:MAG: hypothetical protein ACI9AB_000877, partial [Urechidicola sp.]